MHTWVQLPHPLGPFDVHRGDRVLHGGRWRVVVDLRTPQSAGRGRVLQLDDGRLCFLRADERLSVSRRADQR